MDLQDYLHSRIPITRAMGIEVLRCDDRNLVLTAPLSANINDKGTGFAGSLATLVTLTGWCYTQTTANLCHDSAQVVVAHSEIDYVEPATAALQAICEYPGEVARQQFQHRLREHGRARWTLQVTLRSGEVTTVRFRGDYVAKITANRES